MKFKNTKIRGSVLIETIIATALFVFFAGAILVSLIYIRENQYNSYLYDRASQLTQEWMEAIFSMKGVRASAWISTWINQTNFDGLSAGTHYLEKTSEENWTLTTLTPEIIDNVFYRTIVIEEVKRLENGRGDIDSSGTGETLLPSGVVTKKITVRVEWNDLYQNP